MAAAPAPRPPGHRKDCREPAGVFLQQLDPEQFDDS